MPDPVPVVLLGRLAIDQAWQGRGVGGDLLRALAAGESIGARVMLLHAIFDQAKTFYEKRGFRSSPVDPMTLMVTLNDAHRMLGGEH